jgi:hypothetical protein
MNVETKEQSKQWTHTHSSNYPKNFKQTSICQKADGNCFLGQEGVPMVEFMQQGTTTKSEAYCESLKNCLGPFRRKGVEC